MTHTKNHNHLRKHPNPHYRPNNKGLRRLSKVAVTLGLELPMVRWERDWVSRISQPRKETSMDTMEMVSYDGTKGRTTRAKFDHFRRALKAAKVRVVEPVTKPRCWGCSLTVCQFGCDGDGSW